MSTKQFISAEEHLAKLGITVQQAFNFIAAKVREQDADAIFNAARLSAVTNEMLSEITGGIPISVINDYFALADINNAALDQTSEIVNSDLGTLEQLVEFNNNIGILSNASLREDTQSLLIDSSLYFFMLDENYPFYLKDGIYDAAELGVDLEAVPATNDSIESLFYGGLINMFRALDESELNLINTFPDDGKPEDFQALLFDVLKESPSTVTWTDEQLAGMVAEKAAEIVGEFWSGEAELVGVLDHSYLGLATA
ncbi:MAG TPA: hypothetical protein PKJ85_12605 [Nitrosomonas nitrosa]|nr:hypothetical protein [Nitrosomonas nitrosa]